MEESQIQKDILDINHQLRELTETLQKILTLEENHIEIKFPDGKQITLSSRQKTVEQLIEIADNYFFKRL